jgi:hypothetical protein
MEVLYQHVLQHGGLKEKKSLIDIAENMKSEELNDTYACMIQQKSSHQSLGLLVKQIPNIVRNTNIRRVDDFPKVCEVIQTVAGYCSNGKLNNESDHKLAVQAIQKFHILWTNGAGRNAEEIPSMSRSNILTILYRILEEGEYRSTIQGFNAVDTELFVRALETGGRPKIGEKIPKEAFRTLRTMMFMSMNGMTSMQNSRLDAVERTLESCQEANGYPRVTREVLLDLAHQIRVDQEHVCLYILPENDAYGRNDVRLATDMVNVSAIIDAMVENQFTNFSNETNTTVAAHILHMQRIAAIDSNALNGFKRDGSCMVDTMSAYS